MVGHICWTLMLQARPLGLSCRKSRRAKKRYLLSVAGAYPQLKGTIVLPERNYLLYFMCYYKHYLVGTEVIVRTDHGSLRWLKNMKNPTGQVARWIERLAPFSWKIVHWPGCQQDNGDAFSRRVCPGDCVQCMKIFPTHDDKLTQESKLLKELEEELITINRGRRGDPLAKNP